MTSMNHIVELGNEYVCIKDKKILNNIELHACLPKNEMLMGGIHDWTWIGAISRERRNTLEIKRELYI